jgi:hypothetical protein
MKMTPATKTHPLDRCSEIGRRLCNPLGLLVSLHHTRAFNEIWGKGITFAVLLTTSMQKTQHPFFDYLS